MREKAKKMNMSEKAARRPSKKDTYKKYGIEFKNDKILSPIGWICELLKVGNDKTGKLVLTFSMLPGTADYTIDIGGKDYTISGTCSCDCDGCYAKTGHYNHANTIRSMAINTYLVNNYIDFVRNCICAQLDYIGRGEVRIHAAGDFKTTDPDKYADMWLYIAKKYNSFRFWTYTKIKKFETLFDSLKNANIVKSIIPGIGFNFGTCEYIINAYYTLKDLNQDVYICKCGIDKNQHCEKCGVCATYKYVLFIEHSTGYNAEKDPLYAKLCEIVNNQ